MFTLVVILHLIVCLFLIFIILIQSSKGAEMGAAFGGSSQTLFGSRGAATFLSKLTTASAILFMITSLSLAIYSVKRGSVVSSVTVPATQPPVPTPTDTAGGPIQPDPGAGSARAE
ncbi:MAG: preprotein translocase subunit SecG [Nitrospirae bacterium]|nr:preprotein translocase subunit SecG [Nitrospirota bacterium]